MSDHIWGSWRYKTGNPCQNQQPGNSMYIQWSIGKADCAVAPVCWNYCSYMDVKGTSSDTLVVDPGEILNMNVASRSFGSSSHLRSFHTSICMVDILRIFESIILKNKFFRMIFLHRMWHHTHLSNFFRILCIVQI